MADRTRTYSWSDPLETFARIRALSGLEALRAWAAGEIPGPPMADTLDISGIEVEEGRVTFSVEPQEFHYNPLGLIHGGLVLTLLDSAMSCAFQTLLPAGVTSTTLELKTNFVRPLTLASGPIHCTGTVIHAGRTVGTAEGRVVDGAGKLFAHGTTTLYVIDGRDDSSG